MQRRKVVRRASVVAAAAVFAVFAGYQPAVAATPTGSVAPLGFVGCDPAGQIRNLGAPLGQVDFQAGAKCTHRGFDVRITARMYRGSTLLGTLSKRCNRTGYASGNWCLSDHRQFSNPAGLQTYTIKVTTSTIADPGTTPVPDYAEFSAQY